MSFPVNSAQKLELSLQQIAMTRVAINSWQSQEVKSKITDFFLADVANEIDSKHLQVKLQQWTLDVLDNFYSQGTLPEVIKHQLTYVIISVGRRLVQWLNHKIKTPIFKYYVGNIFWTSYGIIDEVKIFETIYTRYKITHTLYMYEEACILCLENHINNLWRMLSDEEKDKIMKKLDPTSWKDEWNHLWDFDIYLLLYWQASNKETHLFTESSLPENYTELYNFDESTRVNNFRLSFCNGYNTAAKYFFNQLSDEEKNRTLVDLANILGRSRLHFSTNKNSPLFKRYYYIKHVDMLIFLIQQMSTSEQNHFLTQLAYGISTILLTHWPWQSLLMPMFKKAREYFTFFNWSQLLRKTIDIIINERFYIRNMEHFIIYQIFVQLWMEAPVDAKQDIFEVYRCPLLKLLKTTNDVAFLKFVFSDPDLGSKRVETLRTFETLFYEFFIEDKYDVVEEALKELLLFTDKEYITFKETLDTSKVAEFFILHDGINSLDRFLAWKFENEEEVSNFKNYFKVNKCGKILCRMWCDDDLDSCQRVTKQLFKVFKYNESDMENLKQQLMSDDKFNSTRRYLIDHRYYQQHDAFLECCQFSKNEVRGLDSLSWRE